MTKVLSIRDVIGPIMIGPSSSHTAGALRIASMVRKLLAAPPARVEFVLYNSFAHTYRGHGTDRALAAGILGLAADDMHIRDSLQMAEEDGIELSFIPDTQTKPPHPNTVDVYVTDVDGHTITVRGESIGGGAAVIRAINGIEVLLTGEYHSIVIEQRDARGVLAYIANTLSERNINIATTRMFRERKGEVAYTIMETDDAVCAATVKALEAHPDIYSVRLIESDAASVPSAPRSAEEARESGEEASGFGADLTEEQAGELFAQLDFADGAQLLAFCEKEDLPLSDGICHRERTRLASVGIAVDDTRRYLHEALQVMRASALGPLEQPCPSMGGLIGGEASKLAHLAGMEKGTPADPARGGVGSDLLARASAYAMAVLETNASMGRIVAAPTAGASGVLPAVLFALQDVHGFSDARLERGLACAAAVGYLVSRNATVSGAEGGCQAEVGTASAMAAAAAVELLGGTPRQCLDAAANALVGLMGLVCDPVGGLVEAPCQKRNAAGAANALVAAQLALAGIENAIDFDETVQAMYSVGRALPFELRESALGGLAATKSACSLCDGCA